MPTERIAMRKGREILGLTYDAGLPSREVGRQVGVGSTGVRMMLQRFRASKLEWPLPKGLTDAALEAERRFGHHRQFLKFCGLDLATCHSGTFRGRTKLSKYGNARLRRTFWMAAQVAARQRDNSFRDKLGRYTAGHADDADRRRNAMTALTAKMARVAHAVVKTGTEYRRFLERSDARWKDPSLQVP